MPLFSHKCLGLLQCPKRYFFAFVLQGLLGTESEALWKRQRRRQNQFYFHETLYTKVMITNDFCPPPKSPLPPVSQSWQLSAFIAMCLSLAVSPVAVATVPIAVFCVAWWSQWQFEILVIRLMLSELNTWAPASVLRTEGQTQKPSDEAVLQESARTHFFLWKSSKTDVLWGVAPRLILSGWHKGYVAPLSHLDSDFSVYLGISRSLMNDLKIKLKQNQPTGFYCLKRLLGGKFKAFSGGVLYGSLTNESCWLTVTRSLCLSPYFYLWAYLLFMISCCVTEYFS